MILTICMYVFQNFLAKITLQLSKMRKGTLPISEAKTVVLFGDYCKYTLGSKKVQDLLFEGGGGWGGVYFITLDPSISL